MSAPFTGERIGSVPACEPADVEAAVERARAARDAWVARPLEERAATLQRFADAVIANRSSLLDLVQLETGKARLDAAEEVFDLVMTADYYARRGPDHLAARERTGSIPLFTRVTEHADPVGVVGCIEPWNYPLTLAVSDMLPALLAGNGAVLKPAEETPFTALRVVELLAEAGVPADLVGVVTGDGATLGEPLVAGVDHVTFTGSTATGRTVATLAGRHLVDSSLELGGKNAAVVLADAPVERTVSGLVNAAFANTGQLCVSVERVYVERDAYESILEAFVDATERLTVGTAFDFGPDVGSLASAEQLESVTAHVEDARDRGATVRTGGQRRADVGPHCYEPTVLTDLPRDAEAATEETFGPVVSVTPVADVDEAVARTNDSAYGLHHSVWTADSERGERVARRLDAGSVSVNDGYRAMWGSTDAPMGGVGDSGIGRRHGRHGIEQYTETQTVTTHRAHPLVSPRSVPDRFVVAAGMAGVRALRRVRRVLE